MARSNEISRRTFARRAGMLVAGLGVSASVQSGLLDEILRRASKRFGGGEAFAATTTPPPVHFVVEINLRAGFQFNSLFPSQGHTAPITQRSSALNFYSSPANVLTLNAPGAKRPVYFAKYTPAGATTPQGAAALMANPAIASGRIGIATSEAITLIDGNHTANFRSRAPNSTAPCPSALHAELCRRDPILSGTILGGAEWTLNDVTSARGGLTPLQAVGDGAAFSSALSVPPSYFTPAELELIAGTIRNGSVVSGKNGSVGDLDAMFSMRAVPGTDGAQRVSVAGRGMAELTHLGDDVEATYAAIKGNFTGLNLGTPTVSGSTIVNGNGRQLGSTLAYAAAGFANRAMTSVSIALESDDWHQDVPALDDAARKQGMWNTYLGNALSGFLTSIESLTDPFDPSKKISDSILIMVSSEFTRTPNRTGTTGSNNDDGGTGAMCFLGSHVASGSFGDISPTGKISSFDPATGNTLASGAPVNEAMVWKTAGKLMGVADPLLNSFVPDSQAKAITAVVK